MILFNPTFLEPFGLGCWPLGGDSWGPQDDALSQETIKKALDLGITHFDTAQEYGRGHGEELLGRTLPRQRLELFVATKLLYTQKNDIETALAHSIRRIGREPLDLVYIHWPKKNGNIAGMMEGLEAARRKGIIRYIGVCNFPVKTIREAMNAGVIDACQLGYSLLWRKGENEIIPFCRKNRIPVVSYGSLAEGILTGKFGQVVRFLKGDHRTRTLLFDQMVWPEVYTAVGEMKKAAGESGFSLLHCALRWLIQEAKVATVLVGARSPKQVEENVSAARRETGGEVLSLLTEISDRLMLKLPDEENVFRWHP